MTWTTEETTIASPLHRYEDSSFSLSDLPIGETGTVQEIHVEGKLRSYVTRFGFVEGAAVTVIRQVPLGSLRVYRIGQADVALRPETAGQIEVTRTDR
jgi:Fe2+ transport system protein FeoA